MATVRLIASLSPVTSRLAEMITACTVAGWLEEGRGADMQSEHFQRAVLMHELFARSELASDGGDVELARECAVILHEHREATLSDLQASVLRLR